MLGLFVIAFFCFGCEKVGLQPPIAVTFRYSLLDSTRVLQVTNKSGNETLIMKIDVQNKEEKQQASHVFKVRPGDTYEIGRLEMNWVFLKGETLGKSIEDNSDYEVNFV